VDRPAVLCSAAGWSCFESAFPVLHSGILWADCCAESGCCEVSLHFTFAPCIGYFCGFGFFAILLLLAAVVYSIVGLISKVCLDKLSAFIR
jgi:hypothetical protein